MTRLTRRFTMAALAVVLIAITSQWVTFANHAWGSYHWARTANPFTLKLGDNVSSGWDPYLGIASFDWNTSTVLDTTVVTGKTEPRKCRATAGQVEVCNALYGRNGWLGIAQIWASGDHITQGVMKLNDTYFNTSTYNKPAWKQFVTCQELGHTFGLNHQDENFSNGNLGSCMDYTNNPGDPNANNEHPNQHDYDQLAAIYAHLDQTSTVAQSSASPGSSNVDLDNPSQWGQLMRASQGGRSQTFERDLGNGQKIITFVIWA